MTLRQVAEEHLVELRMALQQMMAEPDRMVSVGRKELMGQAKRGEVIVLDVRPQNEFDTAHLPHARSLPLSELARRLAELPRDVEIVAYCRDKRRAMNGYYGPVGFRRPRRLAVVETPRVVFLRCRVNDDA